MTEARTDRAEIEAATELVLREGTFRGRDAMHDYLAKRGYSDGVIDEALRLANEERREAALENERRRRESSRRTARIRVVAAPLVAMVLGYFMMLLAASSFGYMSVGIAIFLVPIAVFVMPAVVGALVAAADADAGRGVARSGLTLLIAGLSVALLLGWISGSDGTLGADHLRTLLLVAGIVAVPSIVGYGIVSDVASKRR